MAVEACRIALKYMTPVILLTDGYLANGSEPWSIPPIESLPKFVVPLAEAGENFFPYERNPETLARKWALPGTKGLEHRIGGLEKSQKTGMVAYDPDNHQAMTRDRHAKVARIADDIPMQEVGGIPEAPTLVVSWGGTYGAVTTAVEESNRMGRRLAHVHLNYINPFPRNLGDILRRYRQVVVPELNMGQLRTLLSGTYGIPVRGINQVRGKPFKVSHLVHQFQNLPEGII